MWALAFWAPDSGPYSSFLRGAVNPGPTPVGCSRAEGDWRGNAAEGKRPLEGLDPGTCKASDATPGNWRVGVGRRGCGIKNAHGCASERKVCLGVGRALMWAPGFSDGGSMTLGKSLPPLYTGVAEGME